MNRLAGIFLICLAVEAHALVNLPAGDFVCTVEVTLHDKPIPDPKYPDRVYTPTLVSIAIAKTGNTRRDVYVFSDGSTWEVWSLADQRVAFRLSGEQGRDGVIILAGQFYHDAIPPLLHFDDKSLAWVSESSLVDRPGARSGLLHFRKAVTVREVDGDVPAERAVYQAWIDPETGVPVKLDDGLALYALRFAEAPGTPLELPPAVQAKIQEWKEAHAPRPRLR